MAKQCKANYAIQAVEHAFDLLELFHGEDAELGLTELGRKMRLNKNKVFRLLSTLESFDYVEQNQDSGCYRLGFRSVGLRQSLVRRLRRCQWARPQLEALAKECRETVCYSVLSGFDVVTIDKVDGHHLLIASPQIGVLAPAHCTAAGKALLAALDDEALDRHLSGQRLERRTPYTITDSRRLRKELQQIAARGYAVAREELHLGKSAVACLVRDHTGKGVGAVTLVGPAQRLAEDQWSERFIPLLMELAARISVRRGYCQTACGTETTVSCPPHRP